MSKAPLVLGALVISIIALFLRLGGNLLLELALSQSFVDDNYFQWKLVDCFGSYIR